MYVNYSEWVVLHEKILRKTQIEDSPKEGALMSPVGLDKILQITCFLPVVQGDDL